MLGRITQHTSPLGSFARSYLGDTDQQTGEHKQTAPNIGDELLDAVKNPENNDPLKINTKTGKLVDGNSRAHELINRSNNPNSSITPDTTVPVEPYTPDNSMFLD